MLQILLTSADGGTAWRHLLADGECRAGWECVGPLGLATRVGRVLGLPATRTAAPDRLAAFAGRLDRHDDGRRSYSEARRTDPFGVAAFLLALRDRLRLAGWRKQALGGSARLADLSALEALAEPMLPPGFPDLEDALSGQLEQSRSLPISLTLRLASPRSGLPFLVLRLIEALAAAGAVVEEQPPDAAIADPGTDLGRLQRTLLAPTGARASLAGDGTFLLLEADTPIEAAELAASVVRQRAASTMTLVAAAEAGLLDCALSRQGLPTLGLAASSRFRPPLQVLPLRLALAFHPRDPLRAAELLLLPGAPLPGHARFKLLEALNDMPGIGGPAWRAAVDEAAAAAAERERERGASEATAAAAGATLARQIDDWFGGEGFDPAEGIPAAKASALCDQVAVWAGVRADAPGWAHAAAIARSLQRMLLARPPGERLTQVSLAQLHDLAAGGGTDLAPFAAEAGRPAVCTGPGLVLPGPADVLWFGFVDGAGPAPAVDLWTGAERESLQAAGVHLAAFGASRAFESWGWRRPVLLAQERLALVRWRLQGAKPVALHPLADELRTRVTPGSLEECTVGSDRLLSGRTTPLRPAVELLAPAPPVSPRVVWNLPPPLLAPIGTFSASSLESLLGCPFKWAAEHLGQLRPGLAVSIPDGNTLLGTFAHRLLQDMLLGPSAIDPGSATPETATAWATSAFDARVWLEAAPLVRPGREVERDAARSLVGGAAAALVRHLRAGGWTAKAREHEVTGTFAGHPVTGFVDLLLERGGEEGLFDLKLARTGDRRQELQEGRALQLALYAAMLRRGAGPYPPAAYLVLADGQLLTAHAEAFPGATTVDGPSTHETLKGAQEGLDYWKEVFGKGLLPVLHQSLEWPEPVTAAAGEPPDKDGPARRAPPCRFCHFDTLCTVALGPEVAP
ncbi:MAG: RecB family exonuclease [Myxococcaceae bacterium]